eukprot:bmy_09126T0
MLLKEGLAIRAAQKKERAISREGLVGFMTKGYTSSLICWKLHELDSTACVYFAEQIVSQQSILDIQNLAGEFMLMKIKGQAMYSITSIDCSVSKLVYKKASTHTHKAEESEEHECHGNAKDTGGILVVVVLPHLPRDAAIEWHVIAVADKPSRRKHFALTLEDLMTVSGQARRRLSRDNQGAPLCLEYSTKKAALVPMYCKQQCHLAQEKIKYRPVSYAPESNIGSQRGCQISDLEADGQLRVIGFSTSSMPSFPYQSRWASALSQFPINKSKGVFCQSEPYKMRLDLDYQNYYTIDKLKIIAVLSSASEGLPEFFFLSFSFRELFQSPQFLGQIYILNPLRCSAEPEVFHFTSSILLQKDFNITE